MFRGIRLIRNLSKIVHFSTKFRQHYNGKEPLSNVQVIFRLHLYHYFSILNVLAFISSKAMI